MMTDFVSTALVMRNFRSLPVADANLLERLGVAIDRIEAAAGRLRADRDRAAAKAALLDEAGAKAVAALDALIAA